MDARTDTHSETACSLPSADRHAHIACKTHCNLRDRETHVTRINVDRTSSAAGTELYPVV